MIRRIAIPSATRRLLKQISNDWMEVPAPNRNATSLIKNELCVTLEKVFNGIFKISGWVFFETHLNHSQSINISARKRTFVILNPCCYFFIFKS